MSSPSSPPLEPRLSTALPGQWTVVTLLSKGVVASYAGTVKYVKSGVRDLQHSVEMPNSVLVSGILFGGVAQSIVVVSASPLIVPPVLLSVWLLFGSFGECHLVDGRGGGVLSPIRPAPARRPSTLPTLMPSSSNPRHRSHQQRQVGSATSPIGSGGLDKLHCICNTYPPVIFAMHHPTFFNPFAFHSLKRRFMSSRSSHIST